MHAVFKDISKLRILLAFGFLFILYQSLGSHKENSLNRFNKVIVFGDSFSSTGNSNANETHSPSVATHRYQNRYSDNLVWVERLDVLEKHSYASPGATSDNDLLPSVKRTGGFGPPSVRQQITTYLENSRKNNLDIVQPLYVIWVGFNDYYRHRSTRPRTIVGSIMNAVKDLLAVGATNLLIFNQAPLQAFPCFRYHNRGAFYTRITSLFNKAFKEGLVTLKKGYPNASIHMFDFHALLTKIISNNSSIKFANTVDPCWNTFNTLTVENHCPNPQEYVFVDIIHFTSSVHQLIADAIQPFLLNSFREKTPDPYIYSF